MQTMSHVDASFLHVEDAVSHMHIGPVGIFEGPAPGPEEVRAAIAARLPLVPRYRQKVRFVPFDLAARCGSMTRTSTLTITSGVPHCRRRAGIRSCAPWSAG